MVLEALCGGGGEGDSMEFQGYKRADGSVGVRNHVLVVSASNCANELASMISHGVKGTLTLTHNHECTRLQSDTERAMRTLVGMGSNPNVAAALVVGLGCDHVSASEIAEGIAQFQKPVEVVTIEKMGGFRGALEEGLKVARHMVSEASQAQRQRCDLGQITLGVKCTGTDTMSALAGHRAVGRAYDVVISSGGRALFSETAELIGAEHIMAGRAANQEVAQCLYEVVSRMEKTISAAGVDIRGSQPTRGNIQGGITTLEEKSLSAIVKAGTTPLVGILEYAEKPQGKGLFFMDGTAMTSQLFAGMAAVGVQILILSVGGGLPARFRNLTGFAGWPPVVPVIKVLSNPSDSGESEYFDIYAGGIVEGKESPEEVGDQLVREILAIASGKPSRSEMYFTYQEPLELYATGPLL
jgi:altronate dehydratase large subunit